MSVTLILPGGEYLHTQYVPLCRFPFLSFILSHVAFPQPKWHEFPPDNLRKVAIYKQTPFICLASHKRRVGEIIVVYFAIPGLKCVWVCQGRQDWISVRIKGDGTCQVFAVRNSVLKFALVCPCLCLFLQGIRPGERRYAMLPAPLIVSVEHLSPFFRHFVARWAGFGPLVLSTWWDGCRFRSAD